MSLCNTLYNVSLSNISARVSPTVEDCTRRGWDFCLGCNDVVSFISGDKSIEETKKELVAAMLARLKYISEFIACCHRIDLELTVEPVGGHIWMSVIRHELLPLWNPRASREGGEENEPE